MSTKPVLKEYIEFVDTTKKRVKELLQRIEEHCKVIGCKGDEEEPFMDCNKGCPLFFAWQSLDKIRKALEEKETT